MANYNEQLIRAWDEWEGLTGNEANDPDEFIDWATANNRLYTPLEDVRKIHRRRLSEALRQVHRTNDEGTTYRAKQCVTIIEEGSERSSLTSIGTGLRSFGRRQRNSAATGLRTMYIERCRTSHT